MLTVLCASLRLSLFERLCLSEVTRAEAEGEAARLGFAYMETSAATGEHLHAAFACLTRKVARYIAALEAGLACSNAARRGRGPPPTPSTAVNQALREGDLDLVAGICLLQQQTAARGTDAQLRKPVSLVCRCCLWCCGCALAPH
ncbi:hypothetical protein ACSSS7_000550 [Eimeria intestinalis]